MEIKSTQKYFLASPKKLREVSVMIKKLSPTKALEVLPFIQKRAAVVIAKVIKTAIANAKQKNISPDNLMIKEVQINEGPRLKRWRAGARGRAKPYQRKMSHIRVVLAVIDEKSKKEKKVSDKKASKKSKSDIKTKKVSGKLPGKSKLGGEKDKIRIPSISLPKGKKESKFVSRQSRIVQEKGK